MIPPRFSQAVRQLAFLGLAATLLSCGGNGEGQKLPVPGGVTTPDDTVSTMSVSAS